MKYKVGFTYDVTGYAYIEANSKDEAEEKVLEHLGEYGMEEWEYKKDYEETDREYHTIETEVIQEGNT